MKTTLRAITTPGGLAHATALIDPANGRTPPSRAPPLKRGRRLVRGHDGRMVEVSIKNPAAGGPGTSGFAIGLYQCGLHRL